MRKTVHKWFWVWDFEREEHWLNEMAQMGWALDRVGFLAFHFVRCEPGEYTVRLEMHPHDEAYLDFMRETGAQVVGRMAGWHYFRRKTQDGPFDLFSDIDSRIAHLRRIARVLSIICIANLVIGIANSLNPYARIGWVNLLCASLLTYAIGRIHGKIETLERDRFLHE